MDIGRHTDGALNLTWYGPEVTLMPAVCLAEVEASRRFRGHPAYDELMTLYSQAYMTLNGQYTTYLEQSQLYAGALAAWVGRTTLRGAKKTEELPWSFLPLARSLVEQIQESADCQAAGVRAIVPEAPPTARGFWPKFARCLTIGE